MNTQKIIKVKIPENEKDFVNLFATVIDAFRAAGEDLPEYFDEPNIADDCEFEEIFADYLQKYYEFETEKRLKFLGEKDNFYWIEIINHEIVVMH